MIFDGSNKAYDFGTCPFLTCSFFDLKNILIPHTYFRKITYKKMSGTEIRAGVHAPHEDVAKSSVDYPVIKVRHASYEKIEKRALIHQQDSGDITKDFLVRSIFVFRNVLPKQF